MYCCLPMKFARSYQQGHALRVQPALATSIGLAHLVYPAAFEPLNRALGFYLSSHAVCSRTAR